MQYFEVEGKARLSGTIVPQGAKNEALQVICTVLLTDQPVIIRNIPEILDVMRLIELLAHMGVAVERLAPDAWRFQCQDIDPAIMLRPNIKKEVMALRGSVMLVGPLLARFGKAYMVKPGGDKIGRRRLDTHFMGMMALGADFRYDSETGVYAVSAPAGGRLQGRYMLLDEASVTGTANIVMAAVLAQGTTTIYNAACEPYVQQLCAMLNRMGARISGVGSNLLTIEGVNSLQGTEHRLLADMIEVGSFIGLAAMTQSALTIQGCDVPQLGLIPDTFRRLGIEIQQQGNDLHVPAQELCQIDTFIDGSILTISDHTWPGLTPDLLSILLVVATQCKGTVLIHQKMFESRLFFVDKLIDMGAQIILCDPHRATVIGLARQQRLRGISMTSPDIRAGVALLIAALSAEGTSRIYNIEQIDRGYQHIDTRLNALGARIRRLEQVG
jgi:UDP-N-acetylglucosamine 1-carboxyvinyltransferase